MRCPVIGFGVGEVTISPAHHHLLHRNGRLDSRMMHVVFQGEVFVLEIKDVFHFRDEYIQNRNLLAWSFYNPSDLSQQLDIVINMDLKGRKTNKRVLRDQTIYVLNLEDLIAMKKEAGRPQDLADIEALESLK